MDDVQQIESPECERLCKVAPDSQKIGAFLEWMQEQGIILGVWNKRGDWWLEQYHYTINGLLARYYEIDLDKVEAERRAILDALQKGGK